MKGFKSKLGVKVLRIVLLVRRHHKRGGPTNNW